MIADKGSDARKMGNGVAGQRLENNMVLTLPLDFATGGDAFGIGEQDGFEQYCGVVGGKTPPPLSLLQSIIRRSRMNVASTGIVDHQQAKRVER